MKKAWDQYSLLVHTFLFKGSTYIGKEVALNKDQEGEALPVQWWSVDMTGEAENASFVRSNGYFASRAKLPHIKGQSHIFLRC